MYHTRIHFTFAAAVLGRQATLDGREMSASHRFLYVILLAKSERKTFAFRDIIVRTQPYRVIRDSQKRGRFHKIYNDIVLFRLLFRIFRFRTLCKKGDPFSIYGTNHTPILVHAFKQRTSNPATTTASWRWSSPIPPAL